MPRRLDRAKLGDERGAVLMIAAFALVALLAVAAIVVDLASARNDRAENQTGVDAAAAAAAVGLAEGNGQWSCESAFDYLESHLRVTLGGESCVSFPENCTSYTVTTSTTATAPGIAATFTYPIDDNNELMTDSSSVAGGTTPTTSRDGTRCDRVGVELVQDRDVYFSGFLGTHGQTTRVHAVARAHYGANHNRPINLLLTNTTDCDAISINGGGSSGGLRVNTVTDPVTGEIHPGYISSDSNGTVNCGSDGVLDVDGSGATVQADGLPGCDTELSPGTGEGCGILDIYAQNPLGGCSVPACSSSGVVAPLPTRPPRRQTRAEMDHRYNCKLTYPADVEIRPCGDTDTRDPYIDQLVAAVGGAAPPGFRDYRGEGFPCTVGGGPGTVVTVPAGNWWIDCNDLSVRRTLEFEGGNLVITGDVTVNAGGALLVNTNDTETYDWAEGSALDHYQHSPLASYIYIHPGAVISKSAGSTIELNYTAVYMADGVQLSLGGGSGALVWAAPLEGPLADLALWSESTITHSFAGSATLDLEGVFFVPSGTISYQGNGDTQQVEAQFIADKLSLGGNGRLELAPILSRMVLFPSHSYSELIR